MSQKLPCCICSMPGTLREHPYLPGMNYFCDEHYQFLVEGYDPAIDAPFLYLTAPAERPDTDSHVTGFYEYHGKWCLRRINQFDDNLFRASRVGAYWSAGDAPLDIDNLNRVGFREIEKSEFETRWNVATDDPCDF